VVSDVELYIRENICPVIKSLVSGIANQILLLYHPPLDTPAVEDNTEEPPLVHVKPIFAPTDDVPVVYTEEA